MSRLDVNHEHMKPKCSTCADFLEAIEKDAKRYAWLREDNGYAPEEEMVRGGEDLDDLCDAGLADIDFHEYQKGNK